MFVNSDVQSISKRWAPYLPSLVCTWENLSRDCYFWWWTGGAQWTL